VLTTTNAVWINSLTCLTKHGGARDFGHPSDDWPLRPLRAHWSLGHRAPRSDIPTIYVKISHQEGNSYFIVRQSRVAHLMCFCCLWGKRRSWACGSSTSLLWWSDQMSIVHLRQPDNLWWRAMVSLFIINILERKISLYVVRAFPLSKIVFWETAFYYNNIELLHFWLPAGVVWVPDYETRGFGFKSR
jgi:hypothetical protein